MAMKSQLNLLDSNGNHQHNHRRRQQQQGFKVLLGLAFLLLLAFFAYYFVRHHRDANGTCIMDDDDGDDDGSQYAYSDADADSQFDSSGEHLDSEQNSDGTENDGKYPPPVRDPRFPRLPPEFTSKVDKSCQHIVYVGNPFLGKASDREITDLLGGCERQFLGFCEGSEMVVIPGNNHTTFFYQRSTHGVWMATGFVREYHQNCSSMMDGTLKDSLFGSLWEFVINYGRANASRMCHRKTENKLPRLHDLPLPAPFPDQFAAEYAGECRFVFGAWNDNFNKTVSNKRFYSRCRMDSGYCMERSKEVFHTRQGVQYQLQPITLLSRNGGYMYVGCKSKDSVFSACEL